MYRLFNWWKFFKQVLSKDDKVLDIYDTVSPGHRANVTQWLARTPIVNHNAHVRRIDNSISIKVNNWDYRCLPYIVITLPAGS